MVPGSTTRVELPALRVGGRWVVLPAHVEAFLAACNPDAAPVPESPAAYARRVKAAVREADRLLGREDRS